jgi:hypothetical protein
MKRKIPVFLVSVFSALLLTMCRFYDQSERVTPIEGLSCLAYTDYFEQGLQVTRGMECYYTCPGGIAGPFDLEADPSLTNSKEDLDQRLCSDTSLLSTPTPAAESASPTPAESPTLFASPTVEASSAPENPPTLESPLLTGEVTMCDGTTDLISFRITQPPPDLTGQTLTAEISGLESTCAVNPVNPSLLTCTIPPAMTFPARVIVSLDGAVVSDFTYDGVGCLGHTPVPSE